MAKGKSAKTYKRNPAMTETNRQHRREKWEREREKWANDTEYQAKQREHQKVIAKERNAKRQ